jgi:nucleoside-diphosphate-sugar epimerase
MPHATTTTVERGSRVLVTGANGFIASHTIYALLKAGYDVLGTVRSEAKAAAIKATMQDLLPKQAHAFSTSVVSDITQSASYEGILRSYEPSAVLHLAAPFAYNVSNFEKDLMEPAVAGTTAVLTAALAAPSIRRIVHTNSFACIYDASLGMRPGYTYTARDWCPLKYSDGVSAPAAPVAYRAAKAVAEKTAWSFMEEKKPHFDLISLCPAMVFGPFLNTPTSLPPSIKELNTSNQLVWDVLSAPDGKVPQTKGPVWIDVRDVADAHVASLTNAELSGRRLLLAKSVYCSQEIADVAREVLPTKLAQRVPVGEPGKREAAGHFAIDASEEEKLLASEGKGWKDLDECIRDLGVQLFEIAQ